MGSSKNNLAASYCAFSTKCGYTYAELTIFNSLYVDDLVVPR